MAVHLRGDFDTLLLLAFDEASFLDPLLRLTGVASPRRRPPLLPPRLSLDECFFRLPSSGDEYDLERLPLLFLPCPLLLAFLFLRLYDE
jgi:hypothetical protein